MVASKTLSQISISEATLAPVDGELYLSHLEENGKGFIGYTKKNYGPVEELAEAFINYHAKLRFGPEVSYFSPKPLHVFRFHRGYYLIEGLIYSNGVIAKYQYKKEPPFYRLWIDRETVKLFNYPRPRPSDLPS